MIASGSDMFNYQPGIEIRGDANMETKNDLTP